MTRGRADIGDVECISCLVRGTIEGELPVTIVWSLTACGRNIAYFWLDGYCCGAVGIGKAIGDIETPSCVDAVRCAGCEEIGYDEALV